MYNNNDSNSDSASFNHSPNRAVFWRLSDSADTAAQEYSNGANQQRQSQSPEYHINQTIVPPAPVSTYPQSSTVRPTPSYPYHRNPGPVDSMNAYDASGLPPAAQAAYYATYNQNPAFNISSPAYTTSGSQYDEVGLIRRPQARYHDRHGHPYLSRDHSISPAHTSSPALSRSSSMTSVGTAVTATGYAVAAENSFNENPRCRAPPPVAPVWTSAIDAEYQSSPHLMNRGVETAPQERHYSSQEPPSDGMLRKKKKSKMHQCEICQHEFPRPSGLRTHMNSHNNIRPYGCPFPGCEKTFGVRSNAKRHLRTHGNFQSDETGRAGAENPTYRDAYNSESSYRDTTPASVNPAMGSTSNPSTSQQKSSFPYIMSNAVTRWLPASLMSRSNASQLREATTEASSSEYEEVSDDYSSSSDSSSVRSMQLTIPLPAVLPSLVTDETDERYEERNSYLVMSSHPYHPSQFRFLPGPAAQPLTQTAVH